MTKRIQDYITFFSRRTYHPSGCYKNGLFGRYHAWRWRFPTIAFNQINFRIGKLINSYTRRSGNPNAFHLGIHRWSYYIRQNIVLEMPGCNPVTNRSAGCNPFVRMRTRLLNPKRAQSGGRVIDDTPNARTILASGGGSCRHSRRRVAHVRPVTPRQLARIRGPGGWVMPRWCRTPHKSASDLFCRFFRFFFRSCVWDSSNEA